MSTTPRLRTLKATGDIYLGQRHSTRDKNQDKEIQRRIMAGWTAFAKHPDIFKGNIGTCLKRQVYNSSELLIKSYGAETWALTIHAKNKLAVAQTKMERSMLNITYRDRKQKQICGLEKRQRSQRRLNNSEDGSGPKQGTSA